MNIEKVEKIISNVDLFGHAPTFIINTKLTFKTFFGGILSIIFFILGLISTIFFSKELYLRKNPSVNLIPKQI